MESDLVQKPDICLLFVVILKYLSSFCFICKLSSLPSQIKAVEGSFGDNEICVLRDRDVSKHQNWPQFHYLFIVHTLKTPNVVFRSRAYVEICIRSFMGQPLSLFRSLNLLSTYFAWLLNAWLQQIYAVFVML